MTKAIAIKNFMREILGLSFHVRRADHWETDCYDTLYYCVTKDASDEAFRINFVNRCPIAAIFLDETLSVLHEIGHICTANEMDDIYPDETTCTYEEYFAAHDEMIATDWAIAWLHNPEHRKLAKIFEANWLTAT